MFHVKRWPTPLLQPLPETLPLAADRQAGIEAYLDLLMRWNSRINLVAATTMEDVRARHIADSLQLLPLLPPGNAPLADLGSGGGLPGLILAIATARPIHLIESDRRKAAFLNEVAARLDLARVRVHAMRIEEVRLPPLAVVTARALAPLEKLLPHAARLLAPGGVAIFPKGRTAEAELTAIRPQWTAEVERFASRTDPTATIFRLSDIRRARPDV